MQISRQKTNRYSGFTLAEVLITLGIIGIVAAMTIPVLVNYFTEQAYITQFQKVYTELSQAYIQAAQDSGTTANQWASQQDLYNNLKPYLKVSQDCNGNKGCFPNLNYKTMNGDATSNNFYNLSGAYYYKFRLADGASICTSNVLGNLYIDTNGDKAPNRLGYDLFMVYLDTKNNAPYIRWTTAVDSADVNFCNNNSTAKGTYNGWGCSYWVLRHWNMDYLHRDLTSAEWNN